MRQTRLLIVLLAALALTPAVALAHRLATKTERAAIVTAVVRQHELSKAQADCQAVTVSTVNSRFAKLTWPKKLSPACRRVAANGVIIEHKTSRGWHLVTVGSTLRCPIKGIPPRIARDLGVCS